MLGTSLSDVLLRLGIVFSVLGVIMLRRGSLAAIGSALSVKLHLSSVILIGVLGSAFAADMPVKAPVYKARTVAPINNWTGFYVGGHAGWGWVRASTTLLTDPSGAFPPGFKFCCDRDGFLGGGQVGFNWQTGNWVFGVEGDWSAAKSHRTVIINSPIIPGVTRIATGDDHWFATATGRIGYAQDKWLVYAKGGVAWYNETDGATTTGVPGVGTVISASVRDTRTGWTAGAGLEWALWTNWSAKIEYNFMDFGTEHVTFVSISPPIAVGTFGTADIPTQVHAVKVGINYRFGP